MAENVRLKAELSPFTEKYYHYMLWRSVIPSGGESLCNYKKCCEGEG